MASLESDAKLRREVPRRDDRRQHRRGRGNRFWFRAAAISFVVKLGLLVAIFYIVHSMF